MKMMIFKKDEKSQNPHQKRLPKKGVGQVHWKTIYSPRKNLANPSKHGKNKK